MVGLSSPHRTRQLLNMHSIWGIDVVMLAFQNPHLLLALVGDAVADCGSLSCEVSPHEPCAALLHVP